MTDDIIHEKLLLEVSPDKLSATIRVIEVKDAKIANTVTIEDLEQLIKEKKIKCYCGSIKLQEKLSNAKDSAQQIAKGTPVEDGQDSIFKPLFASDHNILSESNNATLVKHQEFVVVEIGEKLMSRSLPTKGTPGENIFGEVIPPRDGKELSFNSQIDGAEINPQNNHELIATIKGHPVVIENGVKVEPFLVFDNIGVDTGDISFDGSIRVNGSVENGRTIDVTGDVYIEGNVYQATIKAGNNIEVHNGILGYVDKEMVGMELKAILKAGGILSAKFINLAKVYAMGEIIIKDYVYHSHITSEKSIQVGENGGKGVILGGETIAYDSIYATTLGSGSYVKTSLRVGRTSHFQLEHGEIKLQLPKRNHEKQQLEEIMNKLSKKAEQNGMSKTIQAKIKKIKNTVNQIDQNIKAMLERLLFLESVVEDSYSSSINIKQNVYNNVIICINDKFTEITKDFTSSGKFVFKDDKVEFVQG